MCNFIGKACVFCIENIGKAFVSLMEILKRLLRDYLVDSWTAISISYTRARVKL